MAEKKWCLIEKRISRVEDTTVLPFIKKEDAINAGDNYWKNTTEDEKRYIDTLFVALVDYDYYMKDCWKIYEIAKKWK